jgi:hypothetical protein
MIGLAALSCCAALVVAPPSEQPEEPVVVAPAPPTWRFTKRDKPVKVVVLAGSIGAYRGESYAQRIETMCSNVEVENLSKTGLGAWALKRRFKDQVLGNRRIDWKLEGTEYWLMFGGGLNSVGTPKSTNHHIRGLFMMAHARGLKVVGLTLTPWGTDADRRFRGLGGLDYRRATQAVSDFILGRAKPSDALGGHANRRAGGADAPWEPVELADIAVDVYDSPLRDEAAELRDQAEMRALLERDRSWQRDHAKLPEAEREVALEADARLAASLPRWYMRPELRSFDHVHPNSEGHRIIAAEICPKLPESWGCACESEPRA